MDRQKELLLRMQELLQKEKNITDYETFAANNIKIVDKNGEQINFTHNSIQKKINDTVKWCKENNKPARIIVLKARQEGVSTNEQGRMTYNTTTKKNRTGLIVAHEAGATSKIFAKAKYIYDNLPEEYKPLQKASNAKELIFDRPSEYKGIGEGLNSKISVQVAGSVGIGRGDTIFYAHLSEFAFWPSPEGKDKKTQLAGILQAVPKTAGTEVVIESTANGFDEFKELWDDASSGKNEWIPLFFAWFDHEPYRMELSEEEKTTFKDSLNSYEKMLISTYNLTLEQVKWYRWTLNNDCNGDINMMKQENPSFPAEAFISTGSPVFDVEKIIERKEQLKRKYETKPPKSGYFIFRWNNPDHKDFILDDTIQFVDDAKGCIKIYEDVKSGYPYVIGGDTKGEGSDFFAATGLNNATGNRVFTLHADLGPDEYTHQMYCLGKYYNNALLSIEINFDIYPVKELQRLKYFRQYKRVNVDSDHDEKQDKFGWKTDGNTRPLIISKEVVLIKDNTELFNDIEFLDECLTFVKDKNGRPDAMSGKHDDILISDMIANQSRTQQVFDIKEESKKVPITQIDKFYTEDELKDKGYSNYEIKQYLNKKIKPWGNR